MFSTLEFKHTTAWVLERARPLQQPVPFRFPAGAVIWVNFDPKLSAEIATSFATLPRREGWGV
jgi:hypothetical protein